MGWGQRVHANNRSELEGDRPGRIRRTDVHEICSEELMAELPEIRPRLVELSSSIEHRIFELPGNNF